MADNARKNGCKARRNWRKREKRRAAVTCKNIYGCRLVGQVLDGGDEE
jgi:hypothetical protein